MISSWVGNPSTLVEGGTLCPFSWHAHRLLKHTKIPILRKKGNFHLHLIQENTKPLQITSTRESTDVDQHLCCVLGFEDTTLTRCDFYRVTYRPSYHGYLCIHALTRQLLFSNLLTQCRKFAQNQLRSGLSKSTSDPH